MTNVAITYVAAKGHRTRWVAVGMFLAGVSSFTRLFPYLLFGPGENVKMYTKEFSPYNIKDAFLDSVNMPSKQHFHLFI